MLKKRTIFAFLIMLVVLCFSVSAKGLTVYGPNELTGTDEPWGCESMPATLSSIHSQFSFVNDGENAYLKSSFSGTGYSANRTFAFKTPLPAGTYYVTVKAAKVSANPDTSIGWYPLYLLHDYNAAGDPVYIPGFNSTTEVVWREFSGIITSDSSISDIALHWRKDASDEYVLFDDISIRKVLGTAPSAGINVLTGNAENLTFDDGIPGGVSPSGCKLVLRNDPLNPESGHKVVALENVTSTYPKMVFPMGDALEPGKYKVSFKEYKETSLKEPTSGNRWVMYTYAGESEKNVGDGMFWTSDTWLEREFIIDFVKSPVSIALQWQTSAGSDGVEVAYFDDISVVPLYEINYFNTDGTLIRTEYKDLRGESFVPAVTAEDKADFICGWSVDNDETVDESIALEHLPITLYAVHEKEPRITFTFSKNLLTAAGDTVTVQPEVSSYFPTDDLTFNYEVISGSDTVNMSTTQNTLTISSKKEGLAAIRCTASSGVETVIYILSDYDAAKAVKIVAYPESIHEDGKSENAKAVYFAADGTKSELEWSVNDTSLANILAVSDDEVQIIPLKNGTVTLTVSSKSDSSVSDSKRIAFTNQLERVPVYDFNILFMGASTVYHAPVASLGWTGDWGMAASAKDKDYVHLYQKYIKDGFSPCSITESILPIASSIDGYIASDTNNTFDYTKLSQYASLKSTLETQKPNLVVFTVASNAKDNSDPNAAIRAYKVFFDLIYEKCPDTMVLMISCPINHSSLRHTLAQGLVSAYADKGILWYDCETPGHPEYFASEWLALGQPGVAAHPGDAGMEKIATDAFALSKNDIASRISPVAYYVLPEELEVKGVNAITENGKTAAFTVTPTPSKATTEVVWSVDDTRIAIIDSDGVLTAVNNGTVKVRATSKYISSVYGEKTVTITGQPQSYTVTYASGCTDTVTGLPEMDEYARGEFTLSEKIPKRDCYLFKGWGLTENAENVVTSVNVTENTTVYAVWEKITGFDFEEDYTEEENYTYGFNIAGGFHANSTGGELSVICTKGEKVRFISPKLDIVNRGYVTFALTSAYFEAGDTVELTVHTESGDAVYPFTLSDTEKVVYAADTSLLADTITGIEIYISAALADSMFEIKLDYVHFEDEVILTDEHKNVRVFQTPNTSFAFTYNGNPAVNYVISAVYNKSNRVTAISVDSIYDSISVDTAEDTALVKTFVLTDVLSPLQKPMMICFEDVSEIS